MEFSVKRDVFLGGVQKTLGIVDRRTSMPVLNNVLIRAEAERIRIVATDREIGLIADYEAQVVKDGEITLPARKLYEMLREIQGESIHFKKEDSNWVAITCGKINFRVPGIPAEEFPKIMDDEDVGFIRVDGAMISDMIKKTFFAMSTDESRVNLNGVLLRAEKEQETVILRMVATDGHRLSIASADPKVEQVIGFEKGMIIPRKGITEIRRLVEDKEGPVELGVKKGMCVLKKDGIILKVSLIDAEYPDYKRVVPKDKGTLVELNRDPVLHALRRMSVMASERYSGVRIRFQAGQDGPQLHQPRCRRGKRRGRDPVRGRRDRGRIQCSLPPGGHRGRRRGEVHPGDPQRSSSGHCEAGTGYGVSVHRHAPQDIAVFDRRQQASGLGLQKEKTGH